MASALILAKVLKRQRLAGLCALATCVTAPVTNVVHAQPAAADAMHVDTTHVDTNWVRETTVVAGDAHVIVSREIGKPVRLRVETNAGTFALTADSAIAFAVFHILAG